MNKVQFDDYIARFNRRDTTSFENYLAEDMHVKNGTLEFDGIQGMPVDGAVTECGIPH